ncbi:Uncharacterised protein [Kluyvera cryocrescens]|uniref:Uncharacterized protein n=1 Tax=Kluyvera cryocrescens TaxID=580 RepID=A0A485B4P8_KLUCR|nr:Uncharacterised protein [Kluyvera cryocrescens]
MFYRSCFVRLRVKTHHLASFMTKNRMMNLAMPRLITFGVRHKEVLNCLSGAILFLYSYLNTESIAEVSDKERCFLTKARLIWIFSSFYLPSGVNLLPIVLINLM